LFLLSLFKDHLQQQRMESYLENLRLVIFFELFGSSLVSYVQNNFSKKIEILMSL